MGVKDHLHPLACPQCGTVRMVTYRQTRTTPTPLCRACAHPKNPPKRGACTDCDQPVDRRSTRCWSCSAKRTRAAARPAVLRADMRHPMRCPECRRTRHVHYRYWLRRHGAFPCPHCRAARYVGRRGLHPLPGPSRRLSFDLAAAVAEFSRRGGVVQRCPVADLREPEPIRAPLPTGYAWADGALVPTYVGSV